MSSYNLSFSSLAFIFMELLSIKWIRQRFFCSNAKKNWRRKVIKINKHSSSHCGHIANPAPARQWRPWESNTLSNWDLEHFEDNYKTFIAHNSINEHAIHIPLLEDFFFSKNPITQYFHWTFFVHDTQKMLQLPDHFSKRKIKLEQFQYRLSITVNKLYRTYKYIQGVLYSCYKLSQFVYQKITYFQE